MHFFLNKTFQNLDWAKRITLEYRKVIGEHFLQGKVKSVNSQEKFILLENGDKVCCKETFF